MNVRSTKIRGKTTAENRNSPLPRRNDIYIYIFNAHDTIYTDQTGGFPVTSSRRNKYSAMLMETISMLSQ
jgi:hypothetical protein